MTKYIHRTRSEITANAMITDSEVPEKGYTLYAKIYCPAFDSIIREMSDERFTVGGFNMDANGKTNLSSSVIVGWFFAMCQKKRRYANVPYEIEIHRNGLVEVYSKRVVPEAN